MVVATCILLSDFYKTKKMFFLFYNDIYLDATVDYFAYPK